MSMRSRPRLAALAATALLPLLSACSDAAPGQPTASSALPSPVSTEANGETYRRTVLGDGRFGYSYKPQVAYVDASGTAWLLDGDGKNRAKLLEGCTGIGSAKRGEVKLGGLAWSPEGHGLSCWLGDLSAMTTNADGTARFKPFAAGDCSHPGPQWAPGAGHLACTGNGLLVQTPFGAQAAPLKVPARMQTFAWAPSGRVLVAAGELQLERGQWVVFDTTGRAVATIPDAYVADPAKFAWTRDGSRLAYPGIDGLTIIDVTRGGQRTVFPWATIHGEPGSGPNVHWVLDDTRLLVENFTGMAIVNPANGNVERNPNLLKVAKVAPDGRTVWTEAALPGSAGTYAAFYNLETGAHRILPDSQYIPRGPGMGPSTVFSGDSARACWTWQPANEVAVFCAEVDGGPVSKVAAKVQVEPDVLGYGDLSFLWRAFAPDLKRIVYTVPADGGGTGFTLHVADLDGKNDATIGPSLGAFPYAWRTDGVYREPLR